MKKALILGVTGQDGSYAAELLLSKKYIVYGMYRKSATNNKKNLEEIVKEKNKNFQLVKGDLLDTFEEVGNGFGRTFDFKFFPFRIDFILVDKAFKVNGFKNYNKKLSDHYPIKATVKLNQ